MDPTAPGVMKKKDDDFVEFRLTDAAVSSPVAAGSAKPMHTLAPEAKLDDMPPAFRELALPKLPELAKTNRARLQMQTPNRLFFYWSLGTNPFQTLNRALGTETASYMLVLKLVDLKNESEQIHRIDAEGTRWFDVEADSSYRAEIGFYAPNRPFVRALYSNTIDTPRKSPSPRGATDVDWAIPADRFARVLEVAGFTEDAFDIALAGDDLESAKESTHMAFHDFIGSDSGDLTNVAHGEIRYALILLAAGASLEDLRWKISPALFAILQKHIAAINADRALGVLKEHFDIEADEIAEEDIGSAVFGASSIHFPKRLKTRRTLPKFSATSSPTGLNRL